jgi:hypothetical protein
MGAYFGAVLLSITLVFGFADLEKQIKRIADNMQCTSTNQGKP